MGLKDVAATLPDFETEDETATMTAPAATVAPQVAPATTTANHAANHTQEQTMNTNVATTQAAAPAVVAPKAKFEMAFADLQDAFPIDAVVGLSMAVPRIKAEQGSAYIADKSLGEKFKIEMASWNYRWLISSGLDSKDPGYQESMEFLRTSYDNATVHGEDMSVDAYLEFLREQGYTKARKSVYIDLFGFVTWTAKGGDIAPEDRELNLVQLSQTSAGNFSAFCTTQGLMRSKGIGNSDSNVIEVTAVARSKNAMKYSNFSFAMAK